MVKKKERKNKNSPRAVLVFYGRRDDGSLMDATFVISPTTMKVKLEINKEFVITNMEVRVEE